jgi:hypothetical protein
MLRSLLVSIVLLCGPTNLARPQVPRDGGQQHKYPKSDKNKTKPADPVPLISIQIQESPAKESDQSKSKPYQWRELYVPANVPNWILAAIAGWAGFMALRTLKAIRRQTDLMKEQSDTARQKERPKLRIELGQVNLNLTDSPDMVIIECTIQNHGGSVAFVSGGGYRCWIGTPSESEGPKTNSIPVTLPEVLKPGDKPYDPVMFLPDENGIVDWTLWNDSDPRVESVRKGDQSIYLTGSVMYANVFNETWALKFRRKYTIFHYGDDFPHGVWSKYGAETENEEQQVWRVIPPTKKWWKFWIKATTASQRTE